MILERRRAEWRGFALASLGTLAVTGMVLAGLAGIHGGVATTEGPASGHRGLERDLPQRLATVDEALSRQDLTRAVYEWRDAYTVALRSGHWNAMAAVGDAALRIDGLAGLPAGHPTGFRAEARQAYLTALARAREAGAPEGIQHIADAFAALGDTHMAARARTMVPGRP